MLLLLLLLLEMIVVLDAEVTRAVGSLETHTASAWHAKPLSVEICEQYVLSSFISVPST